MSNYIHKIFGFILATMMVGCVPEPLEVKNVPTADTKLVVSTVLVPDRSVVLALTKSFGALDAGSETDPQQLLSQVLVQNAEVYIEYNDNVVPLSQSVINGFYTSLDLTQFENMDYKLVVYDPNTGKRAEATTKLKPQVFFDSLDVKLEDTSIDTFPRVHFQITDPVGKNYYMINIQEFKQPTEILESFIDDQPYTHLFEDTEENDGTIIKDNFLAIFNEDYDESDTLVVSLSNISKEYYDYLKTRDDERLTIDFLSEPFNLPSNVEGGYGFFNLHTPDPRTIVLDSIN